MLLRSLFAGLALFSLSACGSPTTTATEQASAATPPTEAPAVSVGQAALADVWQGANPGVPAPALAQMVAAFDPNFDRIANAGNDADNAFIKSTLTFIKAVRATQPGLCAAAPLARFTPEVLAAVPADAIVAFRAMLTDRLALVAEGATHSAPAEDLMSGSMQGLSAELGEGSAMETLPQIARGADYDATVGCADTILGWEALDKGVQSPQLMQMLYELGSYAPQ